MSNEEKTRLEQLAKTWEKVAREKRMSAYDAALKLCARQLREVLDDE